MSRNKVRSLLLGTLLLALLPAILFLRQPRSDAKPVYDQIFSGHTGNISTVAFTPDGRQFLSCSWDNRVMLWDADSASHAVRIFTGPKRPLHDVAIAPDGTEVAAIGDEGIVYRWERATGNTLPSLTGHTAPGRHLDYSPDGTHLASSGDEGITLIQERKTGRLLLRITGISEQSGPVAFAPNGKTLAIGGSEAVYLYDTNTGATTGKLDAPLTNHLRYSPDGKTLAAGGYYTALTLWDTATGKERGTFPVRGLSGIDFTPDNHTLYTVEYLTIHRRDGLTGTEEACIAGACRDPNLPRWLPRLLPFLGPPIREHFSGVAISPDGRLLLYVSDDMIKRIRLHQTTATP